MGEHPGGTRDGPSPAGPSRGGTYREVTLAAILFGVIFGGIMNAAITYAGLKIGFTLGGSAIAAVLGFGVLRGILRRGSILENNIGQTIASAVNTTNAGIIFTVPVLLLLANGKALSFSDPDFWWITLAGMAGALLGCVFIVPLRKQMLDIERLRFPSAVAVAAILKSPGAGTAKSVVLGVGALVGALVFLPTAMPLLGGPGYSDLGIRMGAEPAADAIDVDGDGTPDTPLSTRVDRDADGQADLLVTDDRVDVGRVLRLPDEMQLVFAIAPFAIGAGYLTGAPGLLVLAGGLLAYLVLNPLAYGMGWMPETVAAHEAPDYALGAFNRPLGIGLLLGGALMGIIAAMPAIREGFKAMMAAGRSGPSGVGELTKGDELGWKPLLGVAVLGMILLLVAVEFGGAGGASEVGGLLQGANPWVARAVVVLVATAWIWFAGIIIAQCAGMTDWSPISGLALLTVVLVMILAGKDDVVSAVMLGAALCVAISCASDMMGDLKTGYIVGGVPRRQQIVEIATAAIGPIITMSTLVLITQVNMQKFDIPIGPGTDVPAPQAQALNAVIEGVQGGEMPYALYGMGALTGVLLGVGLFPGLGVLVGLSMYLPVYYILTYGIGCVANIVVGRIKGRAWAEEWGVPFCAGLIVGEAVLSLGINAVVLVIGG
jgi:uncharacterized oligopeptide transporter (OPT) family protein